MTSNKILLSALLLTTGASLASAQGDMTVHRMGFNPGNNSNGFTSYGVNSGIAAYSVASQSCNIGNVNLIWTSGNGQTHPVISQNVFRLKGRRFEHLGQSWLKHGFCALCESGCGPRGQSGCASQLRVGCADTYSSSLNDGKSGGPKFTVLPTSGDHLHPDPTPTGNSVIRGRLQCQVSDVDPSQNAGADYWVEGMYVHYEDHQNGFSHNNATWRKIQFANNSSFTMQSASTVNHSGEVALYGWQAEDSNVAITEISNLNEGGSGVHGYYQVALRVWDNGDGTWDYTYVVNNQNSTQGADSFSVPASSGLTLTNTWFNDVDYHSGEPQDGTDWTMTQNAGSITWDCPQTYAQNANANAINWCTSYSFGFTADAGPAAGVGELSMFEPGVGNVLSFPLDGPGDIGGTVSTPFCFGGGTCPCGNNGGAGEGCANSGGSGGVIASTGDASISADTLVLHASQAVPNSSALFFGGTTQPGGGSGVPFGDGLLCAGGAITRLEIVPADGSGSATSTVAIASIDGSAAGETRYYQYWFRDPAQLGCGNGYNTTHGLSLTWTP
jgi:hypothetical protein